MDKVELLGWSLLYLFFSFLINFLITLIYILIKKLFLLMLNKYLINKPKKSVIIKLIYFFDNLLISSWKWEWIFYFMLTIFIFISALNYYLIYTLYLLIIKKESIWIISVSIITFGKIIITLLIKLAIRTRNNRINNPSDVFAKWCWEDNEEDI